MSARETQLVSRMWLNIGHHKSYDGTKCPIKKTPRDKGMIVASEHQKAKLGRKKYRKSTRRHLKRARGGKKNSNFTPDTAYTRAVAHYRELVRTNRVLPL